MSYCRYQDEMVMVKVYLLGKNDLVEEVRVFALPKDSRFKDLQKITLTVFGELMGPLRMWYRDDEGSLVRFSSDEELQACLYSVKDDTLRLYIKGEMVMTKVYLLGKDDLVEEVRVFALPMNHSFKELQSRTLSVFGNIRGPLRMLYRDDEGDLVMFSSDEELRTYLDSVKDDTFRLYIKEDNRLFPIRGPPEPSAADPLTEFWTTRGLELQQEIVNAILGTNDRLDELVDMFKHFAKTKE